MTMMIFVVMVVAVKAVAGTRLVGLKEVTTLGAADTAALCGHHLKYSAQLGSHKHTYSCQTK